MFILWSVEPPSYDGMDRVFREGRRSRKVWIEEPFRGAVGPERRRGNSGLFYMPQKEEGQRSSRHRAMAASVVARVTIFAIVSVVRQVELQSRSDSKPFESELAQSLFYISNIER
jgi:hypothetical protein